MSEIDSMEIAPEFTVSDWKKLQLQDPLSKDWEKAISVFEKRIKSRFIEPADILIEAYKKDSSKKVGFAVLALDLVVIETMQHFRSDIVWGESQNSDWQSRQFFVDFICKEKSFKSSDVSESLAHCLYTRYRNGIFHQGETKGDFRVRPDGPLINRRGVFPHDITINRTLFHEAVKNAFDQYCGELQGKSNSKLRDNFLKKMNAICGIRSGA